MYDTALGEECNILLRVCRVSPGKRLLATMNSLGGKPNDHRFGSEKDYR